MTQGITCSCGALLVEDVDERGVRPVGSDGFITFRRTTDYVMCEKCMAMYDVRSLIEKATSSEVIGLLETLAAHSQDDE
ncbi:MAG TPA: hypothetical protein VM600_00510 [Actinomycetota bacterium]|nr:hypothetical protein [Actinomycetota bacterium]